MANRMRGPGLVLGVTITAGLAMAAPAEPVGKIARTQGWSVVSQGAQYVRASEGMALREGNRLIALENSAVTIRFADGCELNVAENELVTIGPVSSCASEAVGRYPIDPNSAVARSGELSSQLQPAALEPPTPPPPPPLAVVPAAAAWNWVVPAALAGAAVLLAADSGGDDGDGGPPPISP